MKIGKSRKQKILSAGQRSLFLNFHEFDFIKKWVHPTFAYKT
jgi:hypothetical protein